MAEPKSEIDHELIRELARLLDETGLTEIEIERAGLRVRVGRAAASAPVAVAVPAAPQASTATAGPMPADPAKHPGVVTSPMVGTAYVGPEPGAPPFVDVGSKVLVGETLMIIEAMKTMNQIPAPRAGRVKRILVDDGAPVEFGAPLMILE
jgi:acetyl-CoA carboxylase biotin carboxyl carrier protein